MRLCLEFAPACGYPSRVLACVDHGGPWLKDQHTIEQWTLEASMDWVKWSLIAALEAGYDLLHIDPNEPMKAEHVIDLSHRLIPGKEHFKFHTHVDDVTKIIPAVKHRPDIWYILGEVTFCTHVGTHVEVPYHHQKDGADTATVPIAPLIAPGVVLDFSHKKPGETITLAELKQHEHRIRPGDIVFIRQGADKLYYTDQWNDQAHLSVEANQWLVDQGIACMGTDATGLEVPGTDHQPNHLAACKAGVPMIESLRGLEQLGTERHLIIVLPLPLQGCDASPLRVVAIKKEGLQDLLKGLQP